MNNIVYDLSNTNNVNMEIIEHHDGVVDDDSLVDDDGDNIIEHTLRTIINNLKNENQSLTTIIQELVSDKEQLVSDKEHLANQLQKLQREYNILRDKSSTQKSNHFHKMVFN